MAVLTVYCEPVSKFFPDTGKNIGNFLLSSKALPVSLGKLLILHVVDCD